eukprot:scpid73101/ scgid21602/ 
MYRTGHATIQRRVGIATGSMNELPCKLAAFLYLNMALVGLSANCISTRETTVAAAPDPLRLDNWLLNRTHGHEGNWTGVQQEFMDVGIAKIPSCMNFLMGRTQCDVTTVVGNTYMYNGIVNAVGSSLRETARIEVLAKQLKKPENANIHNVISLAILEQIAMNISRTLVMGDDWRNNGCDNILNRCLDVNSSEERIQHFHKLRHCLAQAVEILVTTLHHIEEFCRIDRLLMMATDVQSGTNGTYDVHTNGTAFTNGPQCLQQKDHACCTGDTFNITIDNNSTGDLSMLSCFLNQSTILYRLAQLQESMAKAESTLNHFRHGLSTVLRPKYRYTWDIAKDISRTVCTSILSKGNSKLAHVKICPSQCFDTLQLLEALATIQPDVFAESSSEGKTLQFLQRIFSVECMKPEVNQCLADNQSSISEYSKQNKTCISVTPFSNITTAGGYSVSMADAHQYQYCTSTVYINISCQYPFVPISSDAIQSDKMTWLATRLAKTACGAVNRSNCAVPSTLLHCNMICEAVWFEEARESGLLQRWLYVVWTFAMLACISNAFALITFIRNHHRIKSPARRAVVCMNLGMFMYLMGYILVPFKNASVIVNGACTDHNSITMLRSTDVSACSFSSFAAHFSSRFVTISVGIIGHSWHSLVIKLTSSFPPEKRRSHARISYVYFACALSGSLVMSSITLAVQTVRGIPPYYTCLADIKTAFYTLTIPYLLVATYGIVCLIRTLPRLKRLLASRLSLSYHASRQGSNASRKRGRGRHARSATARGLFRLFKLLSAYLLAASLHFLAFIVYQIPAYISEVTDNDMQRDSDGILPHSQCLMTTNSQTQNCSHIRQTSLTIEMTFHVCTAGICVFFSAWAYSMDYWKDVWPFRTLYQQQSSVKRNGI